MSAKNSGAPCARSPHSCHLTLGGVSEAFTCMAALRPVARSKGGEVDVFLDGPVGFPEDGGVTAAQFREQLARADGAPLLVHFNSVGGVVTEGMAMYNALRAYKGRKVGLVEGLAASIASVVLMACDEIRVAKGAYVMIHNPSGGVKGGAEDMRKAADTLESMRSELLDIYEARTGIERKKLEKMLDAETYLTAEEAVECGMAERVENFEARISLQAVARLDPEKVPAELRASAKGKRTAMKPKMKAKIQAAKDELAKLEAMAAKGEDAPEDSDEDEPEDSEDEPHDSDDDEPEDSEDDDEKEEAKALVSTVKELTGCKSASAALGKIVAIVSKAGATSVSNREGLIDAAIKSGKMPRAQKKLAMGMSDKAFSSFVASMGGASFLKLGRTHTPPKEAPTVLEPGERPGSKSGDPTNRVARMFGVKATDIKTAAPECAPQLNGGNR